MGQTAEGAVNAFGLDGGSSSAMVWEGEVVNIPSDGDTGRLLPNAILFRQEALAFSHIRRFPYRQRPISRHSLLEDLHYVCYSSGMIDRVLIDTLTLQARDFASQWKNLIRKAPQLKHYNVLDDETLIKADIPFYPLLARSLDRGLDRAMVGDFFVRVGKERMKGEFPVSEVIYAVSLAERVVLDYLMNDFAPDNSVRMYQAMRVVSKVAEFFLLGCFYLTKGFLEETYTHMNRNDSVSEALLKKYFRDDFFFKNESTTSP
jgi:hypothetical protein